MSTAQMNQQLDEFLLQQSEAVQRRIEELRKAHSHALPKLGTKEPITRITYDRLVREEAHRLWVYYESGRRYHDWGTAEKQLGWGRDYAETPDELIIPRAEKLHELRKDADAKQDWAEAEIIINSLFEVVG